MRNTAARYADVATNSAPISTESGFSQLETGSPVAFPTGTRPDATAPTTVPMKNGVSSDESPKSRSARCRPASRRAVLWKAKPEPRSTMPSAARLSGMKSVEKIAANAAEKPVQSTTRTKISHTWFASQTGPIAQSISSRARLAALAAAGDQAPEPRPEVGAAEHRVRRHAYPQHPGHGVRRAHCGASGSATGGDGP